MDENLLAGFNGIFSDFSSANLRFFVSFSF